MAGFVHVFSQGRVQEVNEFVEENEQVEIPILYIPPEVEIKQQQRIADVRNARNQADINRSLAELKEVAQNGTNLMPAILACTRAYATLGEMCSTLAEVFGVHEEAAVF